VNPFHRQLPAWSPLSLAAIRAAWAGRRDSSAPSILAGRLRAEYQADDLLLTASGTVALTLAIRASAAGGARPRVALPGYSCYDLATAADGADAEVHLYDLDPTTLGPDPASYHAALEAGVDSVVLVHLYGVPVDPEFARLAARAGAAVIDDAAQGVGGSFDGRELGRMGDLGVLSFGRGKGRTGGSGGALLATSALGLERLRRLAPLAPADADSARPLAALAAQWVIGRPSLYGLATSLPWLRLGQTIYHPPPAPRAIRPDAAATLLALDQAVANESDQRRRSGDGWAEDLRGAKEVRTVRIGPGARPGWLRFPVRPLGSVRERLSSHIGRRLGVMPGYPVPLGALAGFGHRVVGSAVWRGAAELSAGLFTLPTHGLLDSADRKALLRLFR
jgi:dTDP-4-amino-4,6-dideoxygalactose transaminase